jgi:hypothetical protein
MRFLFTLIILLTTAGFIHAQPGPGDIFKEYIWYNETGDCGGALRVGGRLDYNLLEKGFNYIGDGMIQPAFDIDLKNAIGAELVVEKMLCHGETEGLRVIINKKQTVHIPEAVNIPEPQSAYAHHFNAVVPVDISTLLPGTGNTFSFQVDTAGHWWPQNLVYGMILRIYYQPSQIETTGKITSPVSGEKLGSVNQIIVETEKPEAISRIDLIGYYRDVDLEGDGIYRQWHYGFHKGEIFNHIGTVSETPYQFSWDTEWIPDQDDKIQIMARISRKDGYIHMTEAVTDLSLSRSGISVELCEPYDQPEGWFTRKGEFQQGFNLNGNLEHAVEAKMVFKSWSPGYFNGIYINDFLVFIKEGPRYQYYVHDIDIEDLHVFSSGKNILKTGKTPLYHGKMVHGVEIQWPGIMVLIKYDQNK